jgi:hypothetical protein
VPTNQDMETIANGCSDSASNKALSSLITGIGREPAAERIAYEAAAMLLSGYKAEDGGNVKAVLDLLLELRRTMLQRRCSTFRWWAHIRPP